MKNIPGCSVLVCGFILSTALARADAEPLNDAMRGRAHGEMGELYFKSMDANGDGAVSKSEFNANSSKRFKKLDANQDGKLTLDEMPGGSKPGHGDGTMHLDERFNAADADHDGGIDKVEAEAMPMLLRYFDEVDENRDGKVTRQEYLDAMPRLHRGKQPGPGGKSQAL